MYIYLYTYILYIHTIYDIGIIARANVYIVYYMSIYAYIHMCIYNYIVKNDVRHTFCEYFNLKTLNVKDIVSKIAFCTDDFSFLLSSINYIYYYISRTFNTAWKEHAHFFIKKIFQSRFLQMILLNILTYTRFTLFNTFFYIATLIVTLVCLFLFENTWKRKRIKIVNTKKKKKKNNN